MVTESAIAGKPIGVKRPPSKRKSAALVTLSMLAIAVICVALLGVYGIPVTVVIVLVGFHFLARWYHRRYYGTYSAK